MKNFLNLKTIWMLIAAVGFLAACETTDDVTDDNTDNTVDDKTVIVTENISSATTWETGKTYVLAGRITVLDGVTLTIQPGTIIKGQAGSEANATALLVARGAKLMAEGTATQPIIFTSIADEIEPGQIASPNLDPSLNGLWGGVIVLGKAPINADAASIQIEGVPPSDSNGLYGGTDAADNSGVIKYISIRHGGANIGEGNEINGLTLGGVGSGTVVENVEIVANQDDGVEFFGGTVNVTNVVVWNNGDDAIDTDQGYIGTVDNILIVNPGDEAFELDGPEGDAPKTGNHTLKNGTVYAEDASGLVDFDTNTNVDMTNMYFTKLSEGQNVEEVPDGTVSNLEATLADGTTLEDVFGDLASAAKAVTTATVGANESAFNGWTWVKSSK